MNSRTILIVEDKAEIREGIRILLSGENYTILEAENGQQGLNMLTDSVDLVILDVMMSAFVCNMDNVQFVRKVYIFISFRFSP